MSFRLYTKGVKQGTWDCLEGYRLSKKKLLTILQQDDVIDDMDDSIGSESIGFRDLRSSDVHRVRAVRADLYQSMIQYIFCLECGR